jgi:hypothetical protein
MQQNPATAKATVSDIIRTATELNEHQSPVIRISMEGKILFANSAAHLILKDWRCEEENFLPSWILKLHPEILNKAADSDITIYSSSYQVKFSVVGFPDGGYISLSAYETTSSDTSAKGEELADEIQSIGSCTDCLS